MNEYLFSGLILTTALLTGGREEARVEALGPLGVLLFAPLRRSRLRLTNLGLIPLLLPLTHSLPTPPLRQLLEPKIRKLVNSKVLALPEL